MAENRKFSSRRDNPGQSVFKQDLFLLSVPSGSAPRALAVDDDGRVISTIVSASGDGSSGSSGASASTGSSGTSGTSGGTSGTSGTSGASGS